MVIGGGFLADKMSIFAKRNYQENKSIVSFLRPCRAAVHIIDINLRFNLCMQHHLCQDGNSAEKNIYL